MEDRLRPYIGLAIDRAEELEAVESSLPRFALEGVFDAALIRRLMGGPASAGTVRLVLEALADLGALDRDPSGFRFVPQQFSATAGLRAGIKIGLRAAQSQMRGGARLVASVPPTLDEGIRAALSDEAIDLRVALLDLIASARSHLVLASPFWDEPTTAELLEKVSRRLEAGVTVALLGRSVVRAVGSERAYRKLVHQLAGRTGFQAFVWEEAVAEELGGTRTFHFKTVVADQGRRAYLGTANFTTAGFRSRFELGILLDPPDSLAVHRMVSAAIGLGKRIA